MEAFVTLLGIIAVIFGILQIVLFFKIWGMTNDVKDIRDFIMSKAAKETVKKENTNNVPNAENGNNIPVESLQEEDISFNPPSALEENELLKIATGDAKHFNGQLKIGDKVSIQEVGTCVFKGIYNGKFAFIPEDSENLPRSQYLITGDGEPYLLIPHNKLNKMLM